MVKKIKGKGFILRKIKRSDFNSWWENINNPVITKNFITNPRNLKEAKKEFNEKLKDKKDRDSFVIDIDGKAVGGIGLHEIIPKLKAKLSYWLGGDYRGSEVMTNATKLIVNHGFKKHKLRRIYGSVREYNKASARVLEKCGFKLEGIQRKNVLKNGKYYDDFLYARVR